MKVFCRVNTNDLSSDSSGNESENDQINKIYQIQKNYSRSQSQLQEVHEKQGNVKTRDWINGSMIDEDDFEEPSQESDVKDHGRKDTLEREFDEIHGNYV